MCVGQQAVDGYAFETGVGQRLVDAPPAELTPTSLEECAALLVDLLGTAYPALVAADERGQKSPTPPPRRHRVIELIDYARSAANLLEDQQGDEALELDGNLLSELFTVSALLQRWRGHPTWPQLVRTLVSDTEAQHTIMLLAVASYLVDAGNGVGIVAEENDGRIPDLWTEPTLLEQLDVEIKTPQGLRGPRSTPLTVDESERLIERQVKRAASSTSGQLGADDSGIVAIGGYHLGPESVDILETAATQVLSRQADRKRHLAGVVISLLSYQETHVQHAAQHVSSSLAPTLESRLIRHPGYKGGLEIRDDAAWEEHHPGVQTPADSVKVKRSLPRKSRRTGADRSARKTQRASRRKNRRRR